MNFGALYGLVTFGHHMRAKVDVGYEIPGFYDFFDFSNDFTRS